MALRTLKPMDTMIDQQIKFYLNANLSCNYFKIMKSVKTVVLILTSNIDHSIVTKLIN